MIAVGAALNIIADAMRSMGGMSWESVAKSLVTMGGALAELAVGLNFMNGTLGGSAAMLVAAAALAVLTPVLVTLGSMSWEAIAKGLVTVAGAFAVIGTAGALLTPLLPTILGLGGAFALIGVGVAGVGGRSAPCRNRPIRHCGGHYGPGNLPWSGRSHYRGRPDLYHHGHRGADPGHCGEAG